MNTFLKLVPTETLLLRRCDESLTISNLRISEEGFCLNENRSDTNNFVEMQVYEQIKDGTFLIFFESLESSLDKLLLIEYEIFMFCKKYPSIISDSNSRAVLFLTKKYGRHFEIVCVATHNMSVSRTHLEYDHNWFKEYRYRLCVPQKDK